MKILKMSEDIKSVDRLIYEDIYEFIISLPENKSNEQFEIDYEKLKELFKKGVEKLEEENFIRKVPMPPQIEEISRFWYITSPFFSEFLLRFTFFETNELDTAGVNIQNNKMNFFLNPDFFYSLDFEHRQGILVHEIMHFINNTFGREKNFANLDHLKSNVAADIPINEGIKNMFIGGKECKLKKEFMFERTINKVEIEVDFENDEIDLDNIIGKHMHTKKENEDEKAFCRIIDHKDNVFTITFRNKNDFVIGDKVYILEDNGKGSGESSGNGSGEGSGNSNENGSDDGHNKDHAVGDSSDESRELVKEVVKVAKMKGYGNLSQSMIGLLEEISRPVVNWKKELKKVMNKFSFGNGFEYRTWAKPHRRDLPFRGKREHTVDLVFAVDTSGSTSDCLEEFFSEIEGASKNFSIKIIEFDCEIQKNGHYKYKRGDWKKINTEGGGGTDVQCVYDYMFKNGLKNHSLIMLTDGYFSYNFNTRGINTVFCLTETDVTVPKGRNICIKK